MSTINSIIEPDWPAPANVRALTTLRQGGFSHSPYNSWNLADHVGDRVQDVIQNRAILREQYPLPAEPVWLAQDHTTIIIQADLLQAGSPLLRADASFTRMPQVVCAVLTADCLPILICDRAGSTVAAVHAGWKGLAAGILTHTLKTLGLAKEEILVWLGPAISREAFEVGEDVYAAFPSYEQHFIKTAPDRWHGDLYAIARAECQKQGVSAVYGGDYCTYLDADRFFSYRRDGRTGRMASIIYLK